MAEHLTPFINFASNWTWLRRNLIALFSKVHWALIHGWLFFFTVLWIICGPFLVYRTGFLTKDSQVFMSCFIMGFCFKIRITFFVWCSPLYMDCDGNTIKRTNGLRIASHIRMSYCFGRKSLLYKWMASFGQCFGFFPSYHATLMIDWTL